MPTTPKAMMEAIERNLPTRTGRTLAQWISVVKRGGPRARRERVAWLRKEHGLGGTTASLVACAAEGRRPTDDYADGDALIDAMYSGRKAGRVTHRIALRSPGDVDAEVRLWLKEAYDRDA
jgi:Domain of unknown function (DUF4287)